LLNEWLAALVRTHPSIFSFYLVTPLPYTQAAIREASHALTHLNAIGTGLLSNHEGYYLGNPAFTPFFSFLKSRSSQKDEIVFIHPSYPVLHLNNGSLIPADPTVYPSGLVEFYFETARTVMDLTLSLTLHNFTGIRYLLPHEGGAFPSFEDRMLRSLPALVGPAMQIFNTRYVEYFCQLY
jgi:predicted TIM-barrel fold metal-dependent hydrolase